MAEEVIPISSEDSEEENFDSEEADEEDDENDEKDGRSKILLDLNDIIYEIDAPGTFACGGPIKLILPGLHINGFGEVSLPLRERDAKEIITLCQQAPFGRGEQTIVDTTVRNTWQLNPSELQILNEEFVQHIDSLVKDTVAIELGLGPSAKVAARLYKLLLYEPGGFFVPHKDTEKEPGMFASMALFILNHQYTPAGLSAQVLKNGDRAIAQMLQEANKDQEFDIYLGLLNMTRSGPAEGGYRGDWSLMDEYCDESFELHSLVNLKGERIKADINIDKKDIYPVDPFYDGADSESVEEATGNEGTSIELRYHKAVIMLWPKAMLIRIICEGSEFDAMDYLVNMVMKCANIESRDDPDWRTCKQMAQTLMQKGIRILISRFLRVLNKIGDPQLIAQYVSTADMSHRRDEFDNFCLALDQSLETFGWASLGPATATFANALSLDLATKFVTHLLEKFQLSTDPNRNEYLRALAHDLIKTRIVHDTTFVLTPFIVRQLTRMATNLNPALLIDVFIFIYSRFKSVDTDFIPTIKMLYEDYGNLSFNPTFVDLVQRCTAFLQNRILAFEARPDDWAILTPQSCSCVECQKIGTFLRSPTERVFRYPSALYNRKHVQDSISSDLIVLNILDFQTETRGSPHTLVITKLTKELDFARQNAKRDAILITQLNSYITIDESEQERAAKRQKTDHPS